MKFVLKRSGRQWRFRIVARNGRILAHSERYTEKRKAMAAMNLIIFEAFHARVVEK